MRESDSVLLRPEVNVDEKIQTHREKLRRIKNMSLMKMINTGVHQDTIQLNAKKDTKMTNLK